MTSTTYEKMCTQDQNFISTCCRYGGVGLSGIMKSVILCGGCIDGVHIFVSNLCLMTS